MDKSFSNSNGPEGYGNSAYNGSSGPYDFKNVNGVPLNWPPAHWSL
jgi:hypothetical protein